MDVYVNVVNQKLHITTNLKSIVAGTQMFIRFIFNMPNDWDGLNPFAQFSQNGVAYNEYLHTDDDGMNNVVCLPAEIVPGKCTLMLYGNRNSIIGLTNYITLNIDENAYVSDASSTGITPTLYEQMLDYVDNAFGSVQSLVGSPLVASTAAAMTDHTKVYVYTGSETGYVNGDWYYWDGTAYVSGGVYNSMAIETATLSEIQSYIN